MTKTIAAQVYRLRDINRRHLNKQKRSFKYKNHLFSAKIAVFNVKIVFSA